MPRTSLGSNLIPSPLERWFEDEVLGRARYKPGGEVRACGADPLEVSLRAGFQIQNGSERVQPQLFKITHAASSVTVISHFRWDVARPEKLATRKQASERASLQQGDLKDALMVKDIDGQRQQGDLKDRNGSNDRSFVIS